MQATITMPPNGIIHFKVRRILSNICQTDLCFFSKLSHTFTSQIKGWTSTICLEIWFHQPHRHVLCAHSMSSATPANYFKLSWIDQAGFILGKISLNIRHMSWFLIAWHIYMDKSLSPRDFSWSPSVKKQPTHSVCWVHTSLIFCLCKDISKTWRSYLFLYLYTVLVRDHNNLLKGMKLAKFTATLEIWNNFQ